METQIIAHRGASAARPENTMAAFLEAKGAGAGAIEFDVHETADGQLVVVHDYDLSRTTDGVGLVADRTAEYIKSLDAGSWCSREFAGERVPFLAEVLELTGIDFEIELKGRGSRFLDRVLKASHDAMEHGRVEFTSSHLLVLAELRQRAPSARIGLFVADRPEWMPLELHWRLTLADAIALGAAAVHTPAPRFDTTWVKSCHDAGLISHAADADTPDMIRQVLDMGAKRISTREPRLASAIIDGSGQPLGRTASQSK